MAPSTRTGLSVGLNKGHVTTPREVKQRHTRTKAVSTI